LLKLPAEIRNHLYAEALPVGNTIKIDYTTYRCSCDGATVVPVFKYSYTVFGPDMDPFALYRKKPSSEYTMLSGVCRQLYLETAVLPFELNTVTFGSYNVMMNFILMEQRLSRQQRHAITKLMLCGNVPGANILTYLPNLKEVTLAPGQSLDAPRGRYRVIRTEGQEPKLERIWS
jgi:hypothetical protein